MGTSCGDSNELFGGNVRVSGRFRLHGIPWYNQGEIDTEAEPWNEWGSMKTYATKEECLAENGEHAWFTPPKSRDGFAEACAVYHPDGHCDWNDPTEKCHHCPATRRYRRIQDPQYAWVEE